MAIVMSFSRTEFSIGSVVIEMCIIGACVCWSISEIGNMRMYVEKKKEEK